MSETAPTPRPSLNDLHDRYGNTLLNAIIAVDVLAALLVLSLGVWLYFHASFF